jgi:hypothetical protein
MFVREYTKQKKTWNSFLFEHNNAFIYSSLSWTLSHGLCSGNRCQNYKQQLNIHQLVFNLFNFSSLVNVSLLDYLYSPWFRCLIVFRHSWGNQHQYYKVWSSSWPLTVVLPCIFWLNPWARNETEDKSENKHHYRWELWLINCSVCFNNCA